MLLIDLWCIQFIYTKVSMRIFFKIGIVLSVVLTTINPLLAEISGQSGDATYTFSGRYRPEFFWATASNLLNKCNVNDNVLLMRSTLDVNANVVWGDKVLGKAWSEFFATIRNKTTWGHPDGFAKTTSEETRFLDGIAGTHSHALPRQLLWLREIWLQFKICKAFGIPLDDSHRIILGAFPFMVGRGIALGDAYAVGPGFLGFYTDNIIDQYAFGMMVDGDILTNFIHYNWYFGILQNKGASLSDNNQKVRLREIGYFNNPTRGPGRMNFVTAVKFDTTLLDTKNKKMVVQPYALYAHDPEQRVEFEADAESHLGTVGFAGEFFSPIFECGFDTAVNVGNQHVRGWDRNRVDAENRCGQIYVVNSQILNAADNSKIPYVPGSETQKIITATNNSAACANLNGAEIGTTTTPPCFSPTNNVTLKNSNTRFRDSYNTKYRGWMAVADAMYWFCDKQAGIAVAGGISSGDEHPHGVNSKDKVHHGFVPLQEAYSGKRVKSVFLLGGAGKVSRSLGIPNSSGNNFARAISGFTNIGFAALGGHWGPKGWAKAFSLKPNMLFYWQYTQVAKFDWKQQKELCDQKASRYLGAELNLFADCTMYKNLKCFGVFSLFIPGKHFSDIKGKPLNADQVSELSRIRRLPDVTVKNITNIGDDLSYTVNIGFEVYF